MIIPNPNEIKKGREFILMPKGNYKAFFEVEIKKIIPIVQATVSEKRAIERSRRELAKGEYITLDELERELALNHTKKRRKTN